MIILVLCFGFSLTLFAFEKFSKLNFKIWDLKTTTAADFAVELVITKAHWKDWLIWLSRQQDQTIQFKQELLCQLL